MNPVPLKNRNPDAHAIPFLFTRLWGTKALSYKPESHEVDFRLNYLFIFKLPTPSSRYVALGLTQHLTETSSKNIP
jgi:hypothetical protein